MVCCLFGWLATLSTDILPFDHTHLVLVDRKTAEGKGRA